MFPFYILLIIASDLVVEGKPTETQFTHHYVTFSDLCHFYDNKFKIETR